MKRCTPNNITTDQYMKYAIHVPGIQKKRDPDRNLVPL